jgi:hypothetical protein
MDRHKIKQIVIFDSLGLQICLNYNIKFQLKLDLKKEVFFGAYISCLLRLYMHIIFI